MTHGPLTARQHAEKASSLLSYLHRKSRQDLTPPAQIIAEAQAHALAAVALTQTDESRK